MAGQRVVALACLALCVGQLAPVRAAAQSPAETDPPPIPLEVGKRVELAPTSSVTLTFTVTLAAGDYMSVDVEGYNATSALVLLDPKGTEVFTSWDVFAGPKGHSRLEYVVDDSGTYGIVVSLLRPEAGAAIPFNLLLEAARPATDVDRARASAYLLTSEGVRNVRQVIQAVEARARGLDMLLDARRRWHELGDTRREIYVLNEIAVAYSFSGRHRDALRPLSEAVALARQGDSDGMLIAMLVNVATLWQSLGEPKAGVDTSTEALDLVRAGGGDWWRECLAHKIRGMCRQDLDDFRGAREDFERADELGKRNGAAPYEMALMLAQLDVAEGRVAEPLARLKAMAAAAENGGDLVETFRVFGRLGAVSRQIGDYQEALAATERALAAARQIGHAYSVAGLLVQLGGIYADLGEADEAMRALDDALRVSRENGYVGFEASANLAVGYLHSTRGEAREALKSYDEAGRLLATSGHTEPNADTLTGAGSAYAALGDLPSARASFDRAIALVDARNTLISKEWARLQYGVALAGRDPASAGPILERALQLARSLRHRTAIATALYQLARIDRDAGRLASAKGRIREAIYVVETMRNGLKSPELRSSYFATVRSYYDLYADILMREGGTASTAEAFTVAERGRGRVLLETLAERGIDLAAGVDPELRAEEQDARRRLAGRLDYQVRLLGREHTAEEAETLAREIAELEGRLADAEGKLRLASPAYAALTSPEPVTTDAIRRDLLDANTALVEYELGEDAGYVWAVTTEGVVSARLPGRSEIEARVRRLRHAVAARACAPKNEAADERATRVKAADAAYRTEARGLADEILKPVAAALKGKRLAIVPDSALALVPFGALVEPGTNRYVVQEHEVVTLPSATALRALREQAAKRATPEGAVAVVADPVFDATDERVTNAKTIGGAKPTYSAIAMRAAGATTGDACGERAGLERLRGSAKEADTIAALAPDDKRLEATGFDANLDLATSGELGKYKVVHFATHGYVPAEAPELSGLVLSLVDRDGRERPGYLGMPQIYAMRLPVDTVVLSACETGLGREVSGEGVIGLVRGFMYAGSSRVVSSLWKIDDEGTAELMEAFYEGMLKRGRTPAAALREAQLKMSAEGKPAYVWGAFQLAGEWR